jgi:hypothetical protein
MLWFDIELEGADMADPEPKCEAEARLGISWINLAKSGVRTYLGKMISDDVAIVLFDRGTDETVVCLWDLEDAQAITSKNLPFSSGMLWDWDWRAEMVERAFEELIEWRELAITRATANRAMSP